MKVVKTAMVCSTLKHISFQGLVLYQLLHKVTTIERLEKLLFVVWMKNMVYVVIDKLTMLNYAKPLLLLNSMCVSLNHLHDSILKEETSKLDIEFIQTVGEEMFNEVTKVCFIAAEREDYSSSSGKTAARTIPLNIPSSDHLCRMLVLSNLILHLRHLHFFNQILPSHTRSSQRRENAITMR